MLKAGDVLKMLVGLKEVGDLDIVSSDAVLSSACNAEHRSAVLAMAELVEQLLKGFDYEKSPEFQRKVSGKSADVQSMYRKMLSPDRLKRLAERFGISLTVLPVSNDAYDLVPAEYHDALDRLKLLASTLPS